MISSLTEVRHDMVYKILKYVNIFVRIKRSMSVYLLPEYISSNLEFYFMFAGNHMKLKTSNIKLEKDTKFIEYRRD